MNGTPDQAISTKCCYCGMINTAGRWHDPLEGDARLFSHGCCPVCVDQAMADLDPMTGMDSLHAHSGGGASRGGLARRAVRGIAEVAI